MDYTWFIDLQEALVYVFYPIVIVLLGVIFTGSVLAAIAGVLLDVAGWLFRT